MNYRWVQNGTAPREIAMRFDGAYREWGENWTLEARDDGRLVGAAIFHDYQPDRGTIELSILSDNARWMKRNVLWALGHYAFEVAQAQAVIARMSSRNSRVVSIAKRGGFECVTIPRGRGRHEDEIVGVMTDDIWRESRFNRDEIANAARAA